MNSSHISFLTDDTVVGNMSYPR